MERLVPRRFLLRTHAPSLRTASLLLSSSPHAVFTARAILSSPSYRFASSLPTISQPSFWKSLIPKPFRPAEKLPDDPAIRRVRPKKKRFFSVTGEWNPATFYIVIFLLIGSMSINTISLRQRFETFTRQTDIRISLLREVVERIQRGENVDVEKALGTGNSLREKEWEEVLREIEKDDVTRNQKKERSERNKSSTAARSAIISSTVQADAETSGPVETRNQEAKTGTKTGTGLSSFF